MAVVHSLTTAMAKAWHPSGIFSIMLGSKAEFIASVGSPSHQLRLSVAGTHHPKIHHFSRGKHKFSEDISCGAKDQNHQSPIIGDAMMLLVNFQSQVHKVPNSWAVSPTWDSSGWYWQIRIPVTGRSWYFPWCPPKWIPAQQKPRQAVAVAPPTSCWQGSVNSFLNSWATKQCWHSQYRLRQQIQPLTEFENTFQRSQSETRVYLVIGVCMCSHIWGVLDE